MRERLRIRTCIHTCMHALRIDDLASRCCWSDWICVQCGREGSFFHSIVSGGLASQVVWLLVGLKYERMD